MRSLKGQARAPDAVDVGPSFAVQGAQESLFAPYKVATWNDIPADMKDASGLWFGDYFGVIALAANRSVVKTMPQSWADLKQPEYKGMVSLNGDPMGAAAAFAAVYAASLANGGSLDDIAPGVHYFADLAKLGNFNPAPGAAGEPDRRADADHARLGLSQPRLPQEGTGQGGGHGRDPARRAGLWQLLLPGDQRHAPNPNAARLWQEFLYSDQGQIMFLEGFAHPARFNALVAANKIPQALMKELPSAAAYKNIKFASLDQQTKAKKTLADLWPKLVKT